MLQNSDGTRMQEAESSALVARGHEPEGEKKSDLGVIIVEDHGTLRKPAGNSMENHPTQKRNQLERVGLSKPQMLKMWSRKATPSHLRSLRNN